MVKALGLIAQCALHAGVRIPPSSTFCFHFILRFRPDYQAGEVAECLGRWLTQPNVFTVKLEGNEKIKTITNLAYPRVAHGLPRLSKLINIRE